MDNQTGQLAIVSATVVAPTAELYPAYLSRVQSVPGVSNIVENQDNLTITFDVNQEV